MKKKLDVWVVVLVLGALLTLVGVLPLSFNAREQCPENATTMPDGSSCIIGAPIGPPLWSLGVVVMGISVVGLAYNGNRRQK